VQKVRLLSIGVSLMIHKVLKAHHNHFLRPSSIVISMTRLLDDLRMPQIFLEMC
jgi:hypothetical protein